ncbi:AlpA family phage regulatory protein [Vibrio parahaemolyticus]|nr:AlpA family phage regulatory protein [Vibrio parahaemolyticus]
MTTKTTDNLQQEITPRFYDLKTVMAIIGISRTTALKMIDANHLPKPIQLFSRRNMWPCHEVEKVVKLLSANLPKEELVKRILQIEEQRKELAK